MSNQQQGGSNEAPKTVTPDEAKPAPQQNQGDGKSDAAKPQQEITRPSGYAIGSAGSAGLFRNGEEI